MQRKLIRSQEMYGTGEYVRVVQFGSLRGVFLIEAQG